MQKFYVDQDGRCLGSFDGPPAESPFAGTPVDLAPDDAGTQRWNGTSWQVPASTARAIVQEKIGAAYNQRLEGGLAYGGKVLQIREKDQPNITTVGNEARWGKMAGTGWPANFGWRMLDNTYHPLPTPDSMIALGEAAKAEVLRIRQVKWGHFDAVAAMTDPAAILAYDFTGGW